jgi:segregation and condensation protein B
MESLRQHIEALIFCSEESISLDEIKASLKISYGWEPEEETLLQCISEIKEKYADDSFAFQLTEIGEGYEFLTKKEYHPTVSALIQHKAKKKLSTAQMETLSIIAYRQPITKSEIEHIRGVNCDYAIQKLLEKDLVEISGKSDAPGKPLMYSTSATLMDYFGLKSITDLPQLKDIHPEQNEIGTPVEFSEAVSEPVSEVITVAEATDEVTVAEVNEITDTELPDRKAIFLDHQDSISQVQDELSADDSEESPYEAPRD